MFLVASIWNISIALTVLAAPDLFYRLAMPVSAPENLAIPDLFAILVASFGFGYFWLSRDLLANVPIAKLGILGKTLVFVLCAGLFAKGQIGWSFMLVGCGDLAFAALFLHALRSQARSAGRGSVGS
jgi:hypothetical protein